MSQIILIIHNVRSLHNVGSILRTADGLGVEKVYMTGITPYPLSGTDSRLPHIALKAHKQISKTSLGAETTVSWQHSDRLLDVIKELTTQQFTIVALEQSPTSTDISKYKCSDRLALIVGNEVEGIDKKSLSQVKTHLHIPMRGSKESFNVAVATALAVYSLQNS
jgi:tRNA G18 (ribose-2'-O)-methylase SpoU